MPNNPLKALENMLQGSGLQISDSLPQALQDYLQNATLTSSPAPLPDDENTTRMQASFDSLLSWQLVTDPHPWSITLHTFTASLTQLTDQNNTTYSLYSTLDSQISVGNKAYNTTIQIPGFMELGWCLPCSFINTTPQPLIQDLQNLLGITHLMGDNLPHGIDPKQIIGLRMNSFELLCRADQSQLTGVSFEVPYPNEWSIVQDVMTLQNPVVALNWQQAASENRWWKISGKLPLGSTGKHLDSYVIHPSETTYRLRISANDSPLTLSEPSVLLEAAGMSHTASMVPKQAWHADHPFQLEGLEISVNPDPLQLDYISLVLGGQLGWQLLGDGITVNDIGLNLRFTTQPADVKGIISGTLTLGGVEVELIATKLGSGAGWEFTGTIPEIRLGHLLQELAQALGMNSDLPPVIENMTLNDLSLVYHTSSQDFQFAGKANFPINESDSITLYTTLIRSQGWQFDAGTGAGQNIPIGQLIQTVTGGTDLPPAFTRLTFKDLALSLNTATQHVSFAGEVDFPIDSKKNLAMLLNMNFQKRDTRYEKNITGHIIVADLIFNLQFSQDATKTTFTALYQDTSGETIDLKKLLGYISDDLANLAPSMSLSLKEAALGLIKKTDTTTKLLLAFDIEAGIDLSQLPLIGGKLPKNATFSLNFQPIVTTTHFTEDEIATLSGLLVANSISLPNSELARGIELITQLNIGGIDQTIPLPLSIDNSSGNITSSPSSSTPSESNNSSNITPTNPSSPSSGIQWVKIGKKIGPFSLDKIGVAYKDQKIGFYVSASLSIAGLTISLDGLEVDTPLHPIHPHFGLLGMSVEFQKPGLTIAGAFLRTERPSPDGTKYDEYEGGVIIQLETFGLSALGAYAEYQGHPSLFVYGSLQGLEIPIPPCFVLSGMALGFGYNRNLRMPSIDQVATFPLVQEAVGNIAPSIDLNAALERLATYIPPAIGEYFLAAGVNMTCFEMINAFALVTISFGNRFEIDLLGLATLIVPTPEEGKNITPLAEAQLAVKAVFNPEQGVLAIQAQLTNDSYILSRDCRLTGGFAFYTWMKGEHAGDFVLTLGGYHPHFQVPSHYPQVPRLGFNWVVTSQLYLKGGIYYALTSHALMAGGRLEAVWQDNNLKAWFIAGANFLIAWKPYHYEADIYIDVGVSYTYHLFGTHHITADVGADLNIWGPEFAGKAKVHLWIVSFTVHFGSTSSTTPDPISWEVFKQSFLPKAKKPAKEHTQQYAILSVKASGGLMRTVKENGKERWIINPKDFELITHTLIPIKQAYRKEENSDHDLTPENANTNFGIGSVGIRADHLNSSYTIALTRKKEDTVEYVEQDFKFAPILQKVPAGLWQAATVKGQVLRPTVTGDRFIENTLVGFTLTPNLPPTPGSTYAVNKTYLQYSTNRIPNVYQWEAWSISNLANQTESQRRQSIKDTIVAVGTIQTRNNLLTALGLSSDDIRIDNIIASDFVVAPQIEQVAA